MRFVPTKTRDQQSMLMLHRTRHLLIRQRTAIIDAIRAHLVEFGTAAGIGRNGVEALLMIGALSVIKRPPHRLELEVTEEVLLSDAERAITALDRLKALGVDIAMDDFGTGYSSLSYMRKFRFDKIKIDRSFVTDIGQHQEAQAIIRAIIGMCRALGMHVNAEGVETREEAEVLVREGCDEVQGFLYARPVPAAEIEELLSIRHASTQPANFAHVA